MIVAFINYYKKKINASSVGFNLQQLKIVLNQLIEKEYLSFSFYNI